MIERAKPFLDLTRYAFRREVGDLTVYGTWVPRPDADGDSEPALAIVPRFRVTGRPAVIALSAAYKYNDPTYLAMAAATFCCALGIADGVNNALSVANLIDDHLSDLISMPPEPTQAVAVADAVIDIGGRKRTVEVLEHQGI